MNRIKRVSIEVLAPPIVAVIVWVAFEFLVSGDAILIKPKSLLFLLMFSYVFAGIPSILFAAAMEVAFAKGVGVRSARALLLAVGFGLLAGVAVARVMAGGFDNQRGAFSLFPALGAVTGFIVGWLLRSFPSQKPNQPPEPTAMSVTPPAAQEPRQP